MKIHTCGMHSLQKRPCELVRVSFKMLKKVSKGMEHQYALRPDSLTPSLVMHPFFNEKKLIYF